MHTVSITQKSSGLINCGSQNHECNYNQLWSPSSKALPSDELEKPVCVSVSVCVCVSMSVCVCLCGHTVVCSVDVVECVSNTAVGRELKWTSCCTWDGKLYLETAKQNKQAKLNWSLGSKKCKN